MKDKEKRNKSERSKHLKCSKQSHLGFSGAVTSRPTAFWKSPKEVGPPPTRFLRIGGGEMPPFSDELGSHRGLGDFSSAQVAWQLPPHPHSSPRLPSATEGASAPQALGCGPQTVQVCQSTWRTHSRTKGWSPRRKPVVVGIGGTLYQRLPEVIINLTIHLNKAEPRDGEPCPEALLGSRVRVVTP